MARVRFSRTSESSPSAGGVQDRPEEILDQAGEGALRRVAHRIVREPRERIGDRREDRPIFLTPELFDAAQERSERRLAVTNERPEIVEQSEPFLCSQVRDPLVEQVALERGGEA